LEEGEVDATLLAVSGLARIDKLHLAKSIIEPDVILPAVAQGAIGIETRTNDQAMVDLIKPLNCAMTELRVRAERAFLDVMDGSCRTPIAALMSEPDVDGNLRFDALVAKPDGSDVIKGAFVMRSCSVEEAEEFAKAAAHKLKMRIPKGFLPNL
jgi:hydroxymethylbilane synthase